MKRTMSHGNGVAILLLILGLVLAAIPGSMPAQAAIERDQDVDNTLTEFDDGSLQMTATANYPSVDPPLPSLDDIGAVQLQPIAAIRGMNPSTNLPINDSISNSGVVSVGRNIFVIGGSRTTTGPVDTVYVSRVDMATGALGEWQTTLPLSATLHSDAPGYNLQQVSARTQMAAASITTGEDSGYIYVIGGLVRLSGRSLSSFSVLKGTVAGGVVTKWDALPTLPFLPEVGGNDGIADASAMVMQLPGGRTFLYVVGGQQVIESGGLIETYGSRYVLSAELNASGDYSAWVTPADEHKIPLQNFQDGDGLWSSALVGGNFRNSDGQVYTSMYTLGGLVRPNGPTSAVYRVNVQPDGTFSFAPSGINSANATIGTPRYDHGAVLYNGSVYVTGGVVSGIASASVASSYLQSDGTFPELGGPGSSTYFIPRDNGLPETRTGHSMATIPFPAINPKGAYIYLIGGSNRVFRTIITTTTTTNVAYPLEGYYISKAVRFVLTSARLRAIFWDTDMPSGATIEFRYRVSSDTDCTQLEARSIAQAPWKLAGVSSNGSNTFLTTEPGSCFQYRARLTPNAAGDANKTPYLLRVGIRIDVPGATDLTTTGVALTKPASGPATGLTIVLHNENVFLAGEPTLPANFGPGGPGTAPGSFFVDVYIYPPGVTPPNSFSIPTSPNTYLEVSIDVLRQEIEAGPDGTAFNFTIPASRTLCDYSILYSQSSCVARSMASLFPVDGNYQIVVVVDGDNNVAETPATQGKAESNNVYGPVQLQIAPGDIDRNVPQTVVVHLPIIVGQ